MLASLIAGAIVVRKVYVALFFFPVLSMPVLAQSAPKRSIDRCAQDGTYFYSLNDDPSTPVQVERDGIKVRLEHPDPQKEDAVFTFSHSNHRLIQMQKNFEDGLGWLTTSKSGAFATTWKFNASSARTQLYRTTPKGEIVEDVSLIPLAERTFRAHAKRKCSNPGSNVTAIKWIDDDHLLLSINAWSSLSCESNFTEGFILDIPAHNIQQELSERELINLPAVCTWNLVPVPKH